MGVVTDGHLTPGLYACTHDELKANLVGGASE